jgi:hypothetical protein
MPAVQDSQVEPLSNFYTVSFPADASDAARPAALVINVRTIGDALVALNDDELSMGRRASARVTAASTGMLIGNALRRDTYGQVGIDLGPHVTLEHLIDEVSVYVLNNRSSHDQPRARAPWEMTRQEWSAVVAIGQLAHAVYPGLQPPPPNAAGLSNAGLVDKLMRERFGYGHNGPHYGNGTDTNNRHEVHVAYALAQNKPVPADNIEAYATYDVRQDPHWLADLCVKPWLRGKLSADHLSAVLPIMRRSGSDITAENIHQVTVALAGLSDDATYVQVDDALYAAGLVRPLTELQRIDAPPKDLSGENELTRKIHAALGKSAANLRAKTLQKALAEGKISKRQHEFETVALAQLPASHDLTWPRALSALLQRRGEPDAFGMLLDMLDTPDTDAVPTKRFLESEFGLKLLRLDSSNRRSRIVDFCGWTPMQFMQWDAKRSADRKDRVLAERVARERKLANESRWRLADGTVKGAADAIDTIVETGQAQILSRKKGASMEHYLCNTSTDLAFKLSGRNMTLSYARAALAAFERTQEQVNGQSVLDSTDPEPAEASRMRG